MLRRASLVALVLSAGVARAEQPAPPAAPSYALSWVRAEGAEGCPSGRTLIAEVERRLGRPVFHADAERAFEIEVTRFNGTYRSDVFLRDADGRALGHRTLQSDEPGCEALVGATALAVALVIDPEAAAREPAPQASAVVFEPPPAAVPVAAPPLPPAPARPLPPALSPAPIVVAAVREVPISVGLRTELSQGLVPALSAGVELSVSARVKQPWGFALSGAFAAAEPAVHGIGSMTLSLTRGSALLTLDAVRAEHLRLAFGVGPALGAFHVAVREPAPVTNPGDFWFVAAEATGDLELWLTRQVFLDLGGSLFVPVRRQRFAVRGQSEVVWQQPVVAGRGFVGAGLTFR
jgi:hypothetical protein